MATEGDAAEAPRDAGLEAPLPPAADPTRKTRETTDPAADDPGNGAD